MNENKKSIQTNLIGPISIRMHVKFHEMDKCVQIFELRKAQNGFDDMQMRLEMENQIRWKMKLAHNILCYCKLQMATWEWNETNCECTLKWAKIVANRTYPFNWWSFYMHSNKANMCVLVEFSPAHPLTNLGFFIPLHMTRCANILDLLILASVHAFGHSCVLLVLLLSPQFTSIFDVTFAQFIYIILSPWTNPHKKSKWENVHAFHVWNSRKLIIIFLFRFRNGNSNWRFNLLPIFRSFRCKRVVCFFCWLHFR